MPNHINPIFPVNAEPAEVFATQQLASEFRLEVEDRQKFEQHCQWYRDTAKKHQLELESMKQDLNIFGWFLRR